MTPEEIEKEILTFPVKELIGVCVGLGVAMEELREEFGGVLSDLPAGLDKFITRLTEAAEEYIG